MREVWTNIGKNRSESRKYWKNEKPKFYNARRLRRIFFIDPGLWDYTETLEKSMRNWKELWRQPCRGKGMFGLTTRKWLRRKIAFQKAPKNDSMESHDRQGNEWSTVYSQSMKIALQAEVSIL